MSGFFSSLASSARNLLQQASNSAAQAVAQSASASAPAASPAKPTTAAPASQDKFVTAKAPQQSSDWMGKAADVGQEVLQNMGLWQTGQVLAAALQGKIQVPTPGSAKSIPAHIHDSKPFPPAAKAPEDYHPSTFDFVEKNKALFPNGMPKVQFHEKSVRTSQGLYQDGVVSVRNDLKGLQLESSILHEVLHHQGTKNGFGRQAGGIEDGLIEYAVFQRYKQDPEVVNNSPYPGQAGLIQQLVSDKILRNSEILPMLTSKDKEGGIDLLVRRLELSAMTLPQFKAEDVKKIRQHIENDDLASVRDLFIQAKLPKP